MGRRPSPDWDSTSGRGGSYVSARKVKDFIASLSPLSPQRRTGLRSCAGGRRSNRRPPASTSPAPSSSSTTSSTRTASSSPSGQLRLHVAVSCDYVNITQAASCWRSSVVVCCATVPLTLYFLTSAPTTSSKAPSLPRSNANPAALPLQLLLPVQQAVPRPDVASRRQLDGRRVHARLGDADRAVAREGPRRREYRRVRVKTLMLTLPYFYCPGFPNLSL